MAARDPGLTLIVTRPAAQAGGWVDRLRTLGQQAQSLPLIEIAPLADAAPVRAAWQTLGERALVVFVSANAVQQFFAHAPTAPTAPTAPITPAWPAGVLAGSTGPGTSAALLACGVPAPQLVQPAADAAGFDSEALWARLESLAWAGRRVLVVRGEEGRDWLADTLRARGAEVDFVAAYGRRAPQPDASGLALLRQAQASPGAHLWLFSSSEAVRHLCALAPGADWSRSPALASHPRIAQAAREAGFRPVALVPPNPEAVAAWVAQAPPAEARPIQSGPL
jgi:uroporphyrinogen-III synthase